MVEGDREDVRVYCVGVMVWRWEEVSVGGGGQGTVRMYCVGVMVWRWEEVSVGGGGLGTVRMYQPVSRYPYSQIFGGLGNDLQGLIEKEVD